MHRNALCCVLYVIYFISHTLASHTLNYLSYVELAREEYKKRAHLWQPVVTDKLKPDFKPFQLCQSSQLDNLNRELSQLIQSRHTVDHFKWTTISITNIQKLNRSYILLGGSAQRTATSQSDSNVFPRDGGAIYMCELEATSFKSNPLGFGPGPNGCVVLSPMQGDAEDNEFLGSASSAIKLNDNLSILAFCDSLWRAQSQVPVGRCFLNALVDGKVDRSVILSEFCQSGLKVATPCMAGHSIALSAKKSTMAQKSMTHMLSSLRLWVGEPLSVPDGRIQIVSDPFHTAVVTTVDRPESIGDLHLGSQFGYAVADGFATAPQVYTYLDSRNTTLVQLVGIQTDGVGTKHLNYIDWLGGTNHTDMFNGFGMSILRVQLGKLGPTALIVGAPYHGSTQNGEENGKFSVVNQGRLYLFCPSLRQAKSKAGETLLTFYDDFVDGNDNSSFLGFALTDLSQSSDGDSSLIAVGAPDLDNRFGYGQVYILRIFQNCTFDKTPVQIFKGKQGSTDFGANLPTSAVDIDFNERLDIVIPTFGVSSSPQQATLNIITARPKVTAECRFTFPPWLSIRRITSDDLVPITISVFLRSYDSASSLQNATKSLLADETTKRLVHQIAVDWNASTDSEKRFQLQNAIKSSVDWGQNQLIIEFNLKAQKDVQDMPDIDSPQNGLYIGYQFLQPCSDSSYVMDEDGTCSEGSGIQRAVIDWSGCIAMVPLTRFVCYPREKCESDVSMNVTNYNKPVKSGISKRHSVTTKAEDGTIIETIDLVYGETEFSKPELLINLFNYGPTFAGGVWLELQFHGNLRFYRLSAYENELDLEESYDAQVRVDVTANETWASCYLGNLPPPDNVEEKTKDEVLPVLYMKLSTYYPNYTITESVNYSLGAGVTVKLIVGTPDPYLLDNTVTVQYRVVSEPKLRLSYGPNPITSRMDNRTQPVYWGSGFQRRADVEEIGPKVEHAVQVEYLGPTKKLTNVTFRMSIPNMLDVSDREGMSDAFIVYLFPEIRASVDESRTLQWVDLLPKLVTTEDPAGSNKIGYCAVLNADEILNPLKIIGMDVQKIYSRTRRQAISSEDPGDGILANGGETDQTSSPESIEEASSSSSSKSLFRRIPKEILQCDRVGYRVEQPVCAQIVCHLDELPKNRPVLLSMTGWLWARTFFYKHISDVEVVTTLAVDQGSLPEGVVPASEPVGYFHVGQTFFFPQIRPKLIHQIPMWPIIVGVVVGIIFLSLLVVLLYCLGFFKRRKPGLRTAQYSKGGADELERNVPDSPPRQTRFAGFQSPSTDKYELGSKRKRRGKHRGELTILHPADLAAGQRGQEEQHLLDDSPNNVHEIGEQQ